MMRISKDVRDAVEAFKLAATNERALWAKRLDLQLDTRVAERGADEAAVASAKTHESKALSEWYQASQDSKAALAALLGALDLTPDMVKGAL